MDKMKLKQLFADNAGKYAYGGYLMTEEKFVEVVSALFPTDQEITAMAEKAYPLEGSALARISFINGCKAIIKRGKDE